MGWAPAEENVRVLQTQATCGKRGEYVGCSDSSQPCSGDLLNELPRCIADFPLPDATFLEFGEGSFERFEYTTAYWLNHIQTMGGEAHNLNAF